MIREQIAEIIINHQGNKALDEADSILALPSGLEDLTIQQVLDWAKLNYKTGVKDGK